jgi:ferredoxin--NADP+ reductase
MRLVSAASATRRRRSRRSYEEDRGRFANEDGVIGDGLYCVGWARPRPDRDDRHQPPHGFEVAERIRGLAGTSGKPGAPGLDACWRGAGA